MSEIQEGLLAAARLAIGDTGKLPKVVVDFIEAAAVKAIFADRKRCADVARKATYISDDEDSYKVGYDDACEDIADKIESGEQP